MHWHSASYFAVMCLAGTAPLGQVCAKQYLNIEELKHIMFSGEVFSLVPLDVPSEILEKMRKESGVRHAFTEKKIWKSTQGSWLITDEVVGKHEMISYAVGINAMGKIQGVEILAYNESYGEQVREKAWLKQFEGRDAYDPLRLNKEIKNITGATLSSKHVTQGVKRLMVLHREYLSEK